MRLVRLTSAILVNPAEVASVAIPDCADSVVVTMRHGEVHLVDRDYSRTVWETMDRIARAIEEAA